MCSSKKYKLNVEFIGLILIGVIILAYAVFSKSFAELHLKLPFLDFPIFVGEILLLLCLILFCMKFQKNPQTLKKWHYWVIAYFIFVIIKALYGYLAWGPLALRHAALLYYPVFAVFGYAFYQRDFFDEKIRALLLFLIVMILVIGKMHVNWPPTLMIAGLILIRKISFKTVRLVAFLIFLTIVPYSRFFLTSRMMIVANLLSGLYLIVTLPMIIRVKKGLKLVIVLLIAGVTLFALFNIASLDSLRSITNFKKIALVFSERDAVIQKNVENFIFKKRGKIQLYNPERNIHIDEAERKDYYQTKAEIKQIILAKMGEEIESFSLTPSDSEIEELKQKIQTISVDRLDKQYPEAIVDAAKSEVEKDFVKKLQAPSPDEQMSSKTKVWARDENAVFRIFIWRDMLVDLAKEMPILGFDFGKPFRSVSLEVLNWGTGDWDRDGWISAHNSYLHMIYRTGIIGVSLIMVILIVLLMMIKKFIITKSFTGILLCGIIINWFVTANFLVTFEVPYTAIPIWTIYGMTFAYYRTS